MPRRSSRLAKKKRVNMNEDAMFYRATKTTKDDWTEVEDTDPVPVYQSKKMLEKIAQGNQTPSQEIQEKETGH